MDGWIYPLCVGVDGILYRHIAILLKEPASSERSRWRGMVQYLYIYSIYSRVCTSSLERRLVFFAILILMMDLRGLGYAEGFCAEELVLDGWYV